MRIVVTIVMHVLQLRITKGVWLIGQCSTRMCATCRHLRRAIALCAGCWSAPTRRYYASHTPPFITIPSTAGSPGGRAAADQIRCNHAAAGAVGELVVLANEATDSAAPSVAALRL
jgi:hypothetical protein